MNNKETIINTERYGDSNEVNYDLIFEEMIPKHEVIAAIKKLRFTTKIKKGVSRVEISQCLYTEELKDELNLEED